VYTSSIAEEKLLVNDSQYIPYNDDDANVIDGSGASIHPFSNDPPIIGPVHNSVNTKSESSVHVDIDSSSVVMLYEIMGGTVAMEKVHEVILHFHGGKSFVWNIVCMMI
jgi:hypothetical protein